MNIGPLVETLRQDLAHAAEVGGLDVQAAAERLLLALDPALRLTLMDALSQAAAEISQQLPGVAIEVRLKGREPEFAVSGAPAAAARPSEAPFDEGDDEGVARITLRIPESLKMRAEALAAGQGQSLNTWLVGAARAAASGDDPPHAGRRRHGLGGKHIRGWAK